LWRNAKQRSAAKRGGSEGEGAAPQTTGMRDTADIEATIAEIESFVDDLEQFL
jgi:hypothetical protein